MQHLGRWYLRRQSHDSLFPDSFSDDGDNQKADSLPICVITRTSSSTLEVSQERNGNENMVARLRPSFEKHGCSPLFLVESTGGTERINGEQKEAVSFNGDCLLQQTEL
ncbi:MAG: hypothetical protein MHM6MM_000952 [Cercozoa sp. M6MM]